SLLNPTLELRAPDFCTLVEDGVAIAALYRTLARHLYVNRWRNADLDAVARAIIVENKWQAQRYGVHATFAAEDGAVTVAEMLERVICDTAADAAALGCTAEIDRCRAIVGAGTSADAQLAVFGAHKRTRDPALGAAGGPGVDRARRAAGRGRAARGPPAAEQMRARGAFVSARTARSAAASPSARPVRARARRRPRARATQTA